MPNTLTIVCTSTPSTEPVEFQNPNSPGVYVMGTQQANGTWQAIFTGVTKGAYNALTTRLKNFPTITATIAASGPVLNIQQTAPAGTSASPNGANALSVTANSSINATAYRFLSASGQAGPYAVLVTQAGATYTHTGLTAGAVVWYEVQYVGGGFYDDSPVSLPFSGTATAAATAMALKVVMDGDSIATENYAAGWHADFETAFINQFAAKTAAQLAAANLTSTPPVFAYVGVSGQTTAAMDTGALADPAFDATKANFLLTIAEPYNTFRYPNLTVPAAQGASDYSAYCQHRKAIHPWLGIAGLMGFGDHYNGADTHFTPPRAGFDQLQIDMVTALRAITPSYFNALAIVDPIFDQTDGTQSVDGVHPTRAAYNASLIARAVAGIMQAIFGTAQPAAVPRPVPATALLGSAQFVDYPTQVGQTTAGHVLTPTSNNGGYNLSTGLSNLKLAAGQDGRLIILRKTLRNGIFGVSKTFARKNYQLFDAGFWLSYDPANPTDIMGVIDGPGTGAGTSIVNTSKIAWSLNRAGAVWTIEGWDGSAWTVAKTLAFNYTGDMFLVCDLFEGVGSNGIEQAQGTNLSQAVSYTSADYATGSVALAAAGANIITTSGTIINNTGSPYGAYGGVGRVAYKRTAGADAGIGFKTVSAADYDAVVGWATTDVATGGYATFKTGCWNATPDATKDTRVVASILDGAVTASTTPQTVGMLVYAWVRANTLTVETSADGGATWVVVRTIGTFAGDLFCRVDVSGPGRIERLQGIGLTAI